MDLVSNQPAGPAEPLNQAERLHLESIAWSIQNFVDQLLASMETDPATSKILEDLPPPRYQLLRTEQRAHLLDLLNPAIDDARWHESARRMGRAHYRNRVSPDWTGNAYRLFASRLANLIDGVNATAQQRLALSQFILERLFQDLSLQAVGYGEEAEQGRWMRDLSVQLDHMLLAATSIDELYPRLTEFLIETVGVNGIWLGHPDGYGIVRNDFVAGPGVEEYLAGSAVRIDRDPNSERPLARAWRTGAPQITVDWNDSDTAAPTPGWRERGLAFGWRSSCIIPVAGTEGVTDLLVLYSTATGFFSEANRRQLVTHLHELLGFTLQRLRLIEALDRERGTMALYKTAMDASASSILIADAKAPDLPITYVNRAFERITGYRLEEVAGKNCRFLQGDDRDQPGLHGLRATLKIGQRSSVVLRNYRKDGTLFWNALSVAPVHDGSGQLTHFIGIQNDITEVKGAAAESARANALYRALMGAAELVVRGENEREVLDEACRLLVQNGLFARAWIGKPDTSGHIEVLSVFSTISTPATWRRPSVYAEADSELVSVRAWRESKLQFTNDRLADPDWNGMHEFYRAQGLSSVAAVPLYRDGDLWAILAVVSREPNIFNKELVELLERIGRLLGHGLDSLDMRQMLEEERGYQAWLARHDPLTNLLNRRGLMERLDEALARAKRHNRMLGVGIMDLDDFKRINDAHGHPTGDLLLRTISERLQATIRQTDAVGRMGGDEFVLVLEDLNEPEDLDTTLNRIQSAVESPVQLASGRSVVVQTSIGITVYPVDEADPDRLLRHADRALYALKENRDGQAEHWRLYQPEADRERVARQRTVLSLFRSGKLRVHYQPVVNLQSGKVSGVEALARLASGGDANSDDLLYPDEFLPQLSAADLGELTHQVLAQAIEDLAVWESAGFTLNVGINFEPATLADAGAIQSLGQMIEASGIAPRRIIFELLERADTLSLAGSQRALRELKQSGARIALDDVGSAYSSLLRVKELPVDIIKLDRSFVIGLERQPKELRFIMNLVHLARALELDLVAEGIECATSRDALAAFGVRLGQGYSIARPMSAEAMLAWLGRYRAEAWTRPETLLGAVALQLRDLDAIGRIIDHRPSMLQQLVANDSDTECPIGQAIQAIGFDRTTLAAVHSEWHRVMRSLIRPDGTVNTADFKAARLAYEEHLFAAVVDEAAIPIGTEI